MTTTSRMSFLAASVFMFGVSMIVATEARAALIPNGLTVNGLTTNGIHMSIHMNGISRQGIAMNSLLPSDAINPNRLHLRTIRLSGE